MPPTGLPSSSQAAEQGTAEYIEAPWMDEAVRRVEEM